MTKPILLCSMLDIGTKVFSHDRMTAEFFVRVSPKCNLIKYLDKLAKQNNAPFFLKQNSRFY